MMMFLMELQMGHLLGLVHRADFDRSPHMEDVLRLLKGRMSYLLIVVMLGLNLCLLLNVVHMMRNL